MFYRGDEEYGAVGKCSLEGVPSFKFTWLLMLLLAVLRRVALVHHWVLLRPLLLLRLVRVERHLLREHISEGV